MISLKNLKFGILIGILVMSVQTFAQEKPETEEIKKVNFGYSKNPPSRVQKGQKPKKTETSKEDKKTEKESTKVAKNSTDKKDEEVTSDESIKNPSDSEVAKNVDGIEVVDPENVDPEQINPDENSSENTTIAKKTREIAKKASREGLPATEIYEVGINDVLFISLQDNGSGASRYYTVLNDGTIDYPLAGELVSVIGLTTDEIEEVLREKVELYENPEITVKVREHASHKIMVLGQVEKSGEKYLRREAMPLYVIRAEAIVKPTATQVILKRGGAETETYDLNDSKTGEILIRSGDIIEFLQSTRAKNAAAVNGYYYVGQLVRQFGRRDFYEGLTLTQAILESGGLRNSKINKVTIRRKNEEGLLESKTFKLKEIKEGKIPDPVLQAGDTIESAN